MNLNDFLLNEKREINFKPGKLYRGIPVSFKYITGKDGEKVMSATTESGHTFVLQSSLTSPGRFKDWDKKSANADIQPVKGTFKTENNSYPLARIRTTVSYEKKKEKQISSKQPKEIVY